MGRLRAPLQGLQGLQGLQRDCRDCRGIAEGLQRDCRGIAEGLQRDCRGVKGGDNRHASAHLSGTLFPTLQRVELKVVGRNHQLQRSYVFQPGVPPSTRLREDKWRNAVKPTPGQPHQKIHQPQRGCGRACKTTEYIFSCFMAKAGMRNTTLCQIGMTEILHQIQHGALETGGVALVRPVPKV